MIRKKAGGADEPASLFAVMYHEERKENRMITLPQRFKERMKELLGEENFQAFGNQTDETHISVTDSELATKFGLSYEPICIVVPASTSEADNAAKWLSVLAEREK